MKTLEQQTKMKVKDLPTLQTKIKNVVKTPKKLERVRKKK